jgi:hypothetical protein
MKALTVWQPHASFIIHGLKKFETRSWSTNFRGHLGIHAAKYRVFKPPMPNRDKPIEVAQFINCIHRIDAFPSGVILGIVDLIEIHRIDAKFWDRLSFTEYVLGDYHIGRFAWELEVIEIFDDPILARGYQRLWNWEA